MISKDSHLYAWLAQHVWLECPLAIRSNYGQPTVEHPLLVLDTLFRFSSHSSVTQSWPTWLFRPLRHYTAPVRVGAVYEASLIFPNCKDPAFGTDAVNTFKIWLEKIYPHFELVYAKPPRIQHLNAILPGIEKIFAPTVNVNALCINVLSPLPYQSRNGWVGTVSAAWFGEQLARRMERIFTPMPVELRKELHMAWVNKRIIPWFWRYEECEHFSRTIGEARTINGFAGPLMLEGPLEDIFPILAMGSRLNLGARLSTAQGAYCLVPEKPIFDAFLLKEDTWRRAWAELNRHKNAHKYSRKDPRKDPRNAVLEDNFPPFFFYTMNSRIRHPPTHPLQPDDPYDASLVLALYSLLARPLSHADPDWAVAWKKALPDIPDHAGFYETVIALIPKANTLCHALFTTLFQMNRLRTATIPNILWEPTREEDQESPNKEKRVCSILHPRSVVLISGSLLLVYIDKLPRMSIPLRELRLLIIHETATLLGNTIQECANYNITIFFMTAKGRFRTGLLPEKIDLRIRMSEQMLYWEELEAAGRDRVGILMCRAAIRSYCDWLGERRLGGIRLKLKAKDLLRAIQEKRSLPFAVTCLRTITSQAYPLINSMLTYPFLVSSERRPHTKCDAWNTLLDTALSLIYNRVCALLYSEGVSPYHGYLHKSTRYATLAADIVTLFQAKIAAWLVELFTTKRHHPMSIIHETNGVWDVNENGWAFLTGLLEEESRTYSLQADTPLASYIEEQVKRLILWLEDKEPLTLYSMQNWLTCQANEYETDDDATYTAKSEADDDIPETEDKNATHKDFVISEDFFWDGNLAGDEEQDAEKPSPAKIEFHDNFGWNGSESEPATAEETGKVATEAKKAEDIVVAKKAEEPAAAEKAAEAAPAAAPADAAPAAAAQQTAQSTAAETAKEKPQGTATEAEKAEDIVVAKKAEDMVDAEKAEDMVDAEKAEEPVTTGKAAEAAPAAAPADAASTVAAQQTAQNTAAETAKEKPQGTATEAEKAEDIVVAEMAEDIVVAEKAEEPVTTEKAAEAAPAAAPADATPAAAAQQTAQGTATEAEKAEDIVVAEKADDIVVAEKAEDIVVAEMAEDMVVAEMAEDIVAAEKAEEPVSTEKAAEATPTAAPADAASTAAAQQTAQSTAEETTEEKPQGTATEAEKAEDIVVAEKAEDMVDAEKAEEPVSTEKAAAQQTAQSTAADTADVKPQDLSQGLSKQDLQASPASQTSLGTATEAEKAEDLVIAEKAEEPVSTENAAEAAPAAAPADAAPTAAAQQAAHSTAAETAEEKPQGSATEAEKPEEPVSTENAAEAAPAAAPADAAPAAQQTAQSTMTEQENEDGTAKNPPHKVRHVFRKFRPKRPLHSANADNDTTPQS